MLLYFASHSDPVEGVYRALSIATGTYIHSEEAASLPCVVKYYSKILGTVVVLANYKLPRFLYIFLSCVAPVLTSNPTDFMGILQIVSLTLVIILRSTLPKV